MAVIFHCGLDLDCHYRREERSGEIINLVLLANIEVFEVYAIYIVYMEPLEFGLLTPTEN